MSLSKPLICQMHQLKTIQQQGFSFRVESVVQDSVSDCPIPQF